MCSLPVGRMPLRIRFFWLDKGWARGVLIHEEVRLPALVEMADEVPDERDVIRVHRPAEELHVRLLGEPVALAVVALDASGDEVLPRVLSHAAFRKNMIDGQ